MTTEEFAAKGGNDSGEDDQRSPESVLLPLGKAVLLARCAGKDFQLDVTHSGEELHWCADQDGHRVEELDSIDELARLGEIGNDLD